MMFHRLKALEATVQQFNDLLSSGTTELDRLEQLIKDRDATIKAKDAQIADLQAQVGSLGGLTGADEDTVLAGLTSETNRLKTLGISVSEPINPNG